MPVTLTSIQVPTPTKADLYKLMSAGVANTAKTISNGEINVVAKLNANAVQVDNALRYGGGSNGICKGLTLSVAAGLNVTVSAGHAIAGTIVEKSADSTVPVPASATRAFIWLDNLGAFQTSLTLFAPGQNCVLIGCVTTTSTTSVSVDTSGVCYLRNGVLWRETADTNVPTDTPQAGMIFFTKTLGGEYMWDGYRYLCMIPATVIKSNGGNTISFFDGTPVVKTAVADPVALTAPSTMGASYVQADVQKLRDDIAALQAKLTAAIDALQAVGLF